LTNPCQWAGADNCNVAAQGASKLDMDPPKPEPSPGLPRQVVYVPSCVTRMMGPSRSDSETASVHEKLLSLFAKAGYEVIYPEVCHVHGRAVAARLMCFSDDNTR